MATLTMATLTMATLTMATLTITTHNGALEPLLVQLAVAAVDARHETAVGLVLAHLGK